MICARLPVSYECSGSVSQGGAGLIATKTEVLALRCLP